MHKRTDKPKKEPIRNVKLWIVLGLLFILCVPWYFPEGSYQPLMWGIPLWAWIIIGVSVALSAVVTYILNYEWQLEDEVADKEEDRQ
jgi:polyferredoxin